MELSRVFNNEQMQRITKEFSRLGDKCYLENTGAMLYPECLLDPITEDLKRNFYMNPHADKTSKDSIEQIRTIILKHFNTDSSQYSVIFTSGCTQSLKLVLESFSFSKKEEEETHGNFVYLTVNHTSALGLREIANEKNANIIHISHDDFLTALNQRHVPWKDKDHDSGNSLFVYPAESNFNGFIYPKESVRKIKNGCLNTYVKKSLCHFNFNWYTLLDAAAFVPTNKLDLSAVQPDFVTLSFYKIFGYPTGLGALLVKNTSINVLSDKKYFGGGTVDVVLSGADFYRRRKNVTERFEDGTLSFLSIIALKHCFDVLHKLIPKVIDNDLMKTISHHTFYLAQDLYQQLTELTHINGHEAAVLYMDTDFTDMESQGATVTFNLLRKDGSYIGYAEFQHMADLFNICIRTGCFCNSGSCQRHLKATNSEIKSMYDAGHTCGDDIDLIGGKPTGAIRVSFGYFNTFNDVDKLMMMINRCFVIAEVSKPIRTNRTLLTNGKYHAPKVINGKLKAKQIPFSKPDGHYTTENYVDSDQSNSDPGIELKDIAIFPIKSCGAFKVKIGWTIGRKGFLYDREWMIVKENGVCLTQKQSSRMCMIKPKIDLVQHTLTLYFKGEASITLPLDQGSNKLSNTSLCHSRICTDTVEGLDCGDTVAVWISKVLDIPYLRLVKQSSNDGRSVKKRSEISEKLLSLSNQAQYLLVNKATVRWLRDKIMDESFTDDINMLVNRFRANLVIDMDTELAERDWTKVVIGNHIFQVEGQCNRCQMVCIDQETGQKTIEPLRTISEQFAGKLRFGIYLSYVGPVDGSNTMFLGLNTSVKPVVGNINGR